MTFYGFFRGLKYLNLKPILACSLVLFLSASGRPAMAQADGNKEDGSLGSEDWAFEYQEDIGKRPVSKECAYENIGDNYECCKADGQYLVVLFNISMDQGQSFGGSIFEYDESEKRRLSQVLNNSYGNNISIIQQAGNSSVKNFAIIRQDGNGNVGIINQFGSH